MFRTSKLLASVIFPVALAIGSATVHADTPVLAPRPLIQALEPAALTDSSLQDLLTQIGYNPAAERQTDGSIVHAVAFQRQGVDIRAKVFLSKNGKRIFFACPLSRPIDPSNPAAAAGMLALLEKNASILPFCFAYNPQDKYMWLILPMDNVSVTPQRLRDAIDSLADELSDTLPLWDTTRWTAANSNSQNSHAQAQPAPRYDLSRYVYTPSPVRR